jgi:hypothetical protein
VYLVCTGSGFRKDIMYTLEEMQEMSGEDFALAWDRGEIQESALDMLEIPEGFEGAARDTRTLMNQLSRFQEETPMQYLNKNLNDLTVKETFTTTAITSTIALVAPFAMMVGAGVAITAAQKFNRWLRK